MSECTTETLAIKLFKYIVLNNNIFHVVTKDVSDFSDFLIDYIWDIGIKGRRDEEDRLFEENRELREIIRRGFSLGIKISPFKKREYESIKWFEYDAEHINIWILRRGFQKFDDLSYFSSERERQLQFILKEGHNYLSLLATEKLDGENSQISYFEPTNQWIIGSKNVTLLCKNKKELGSPVYKGNRYTSARNIGYVWFGLLKEFYNETLDDYESELTKLKQLLAENTLLGELISVDDRQHLINYSKRNSIIVFIGIVSKNSQRQICYLPNLLFELLPYYFTKYIVDFVKVPSKRIDFKYSNYDFETISLERGPFDPSFIQKFNFYSLSEIDRYLSELQLIVYLSNQEMEGLVLYIVKDQEDGGKDVIGVFKIKTMIYSNLRNLRERLKHILTTDFQKALLDDKRNSIAQLPSVSPHSIQLLKQYWTPVYNFLFQRVPISTEMFISGLSKTSTRILADYDRNEFEPFRKRLLAYLLSLVQKYKFFFQDCVIYLFSLVVFVHINSRDKLDFKEIGRHFFDHYINFIFQVKLQQSVFHIESAKESVSHVLPPEGLYKNLTIELILPPFLLNWEEIKKHISEDLSLPEGLLVLQEDLCFLIKDTSTESCTSNGMLHLNAQKENLVYVNIRHKRNANDFIQEKRDPYPIYKVCYLVLEDQKTEQEGSGIAKIEYLKSSILVSFEEQQDRICETIKSYLEEVNNRVDLKNETKKEEISTYNKKIIHRLQSIKKYLPWEEENKDFPFLLPSGYVLNKQDFEHIIYSIVAVGEIRNALRVFYLTEREDTFLENEELAFSSISEEGKGIGNLLECTLVLSSGLPGSGKSSVLRSYLNECSLIEECCYCESFLTTGRIVDRVVDTGNEMVYSILINNAEKGGRKCDFDIILYVSSDGCVSRVNMGGKWTSDCAHFFGSKRALLSRYNGDKYHDEEKCQDIGLESLSRKRWVKQLKIGNNSMKFIINYVIKQCIYLSYGVRIENGRKTIKSEIMKVLLENTEQVPNWLRSLFNVYQGNENLKMLLLVDKNNTIKGIRELVKSGFGTLFNTTCRVLYRIILLTTQRLSADWRMSRDYNSNRDRDWIYIWNKEDVLRCMIRLLKRSDHSTLRGLTTRSLVVLLSFLKLYSAGVAGDPHRNESDLEDLGKMKSLPEELFEKLGLDGFIELDNSKDLSFESLDAEGKALLDEVYFLIGKTASKVRCFDTESKDKDLADLVAKINDLVSVMKEKSDKNTLEELVHRFSDNLLKIVRATKPKINSLQKRAIRSDLIGLNLEAGYHNACFLQSQIEHYVSDVRNRFSLTAITFEKHQQSESVIKELWKENKVEFSKFLSEKENDESGKSITHNGIGNSVELPDVSTDKKHITCIFFSRKDKSNTESKDEEIEEDYFNDLESFASRTEGLNKEEISDLAVILSKPYLGKIYSFQITYLVYIHCWKLAFLTVSSRSKPFEIISNDKVYNLSVSESCDEPESQKGERNKEEDNRDAKAGRSYNQKHIPKKFFLKSNYFNFKTAFPLPIRRNGHLHITLFSHVFQPVISNVGISILGDSFFEGKRGDSLKHENGVFEVNVRVNEEPLKELLISPPEQDSKSKYVLSSDKKLKILVKNICNRELNISGTLEHM